MRKSVQVVRLEVVGGTPARVVKLVDTWDLKSQGRQLPCEFESRPGHRLSDFINTRKTVYCAVASVEIFEWP